MDYTLDETEPTTTLRDWLADQSHEYIRKSSCLFIAYVESSGPYAYSYYSDVPRTFEDQDVTHVSFSCLSWGDYGGDIYAPSNARALQRDYPDAGWEELLGVYGSTSVLLPIDATLPVTLLDNIERIIREYPLYDEDDFTEYEQEVIDAAWDDWLHIAVKHDLYRAGFDVDSPLLEQSSVTDDVIRTDFYTFTYGVTDEGFESPILETPTTAHFPAYDATITRMLAKYRSTFPALFDN